MFTLYITMGQFLLSMRARTDRVCVTNAQYSHWVSVFILSLVPRLLPPHAIIPCVTTSFLFRANGRVKGHTWNYFARRE